MLGMDIPPLIVIVLFNFKGGVGKTSLAAALAVLFARSGLRTKVCDLDPQKSLAMFMSRRPDKTNPDVITGADSVGDAIESLQLVDPPDVLIVDLPPAFIPVAEEALAHATLTLIPIRPGVLDLLGSEPAVQLAQEVGRPFMCVLNDAPPLFRSRTTARDFLLASGIPIAESVISHRQSISSAMTYGKTATEMEAGKKRDKDRKASIELDVLFEEVRAELAKIAGGKQ